jgi:hypothetical protein
MAGEEEKLVRLQVQLPENLRTRFKSRCVLEGATMNEMVLKLLEEWTDKKEESNGKG